jgi:hypothetical protein
LLPLLNESIFVEKNLPPRTGAADLLDKNFRLAADAEAEAEDALKVAAEVAAALNACTCFRNIFQFKLLKFSLQQDEAQTLFVFSNQ